MFTPTTLPKRSTLADLLAEIGDVPLSRIPRRPAPGTATLADVERLASEDRLCELVDGVLVEKVMGLPESGIAVIVISALNSFAEQHDLGLIFAPDATMQTFPDHVRMPDVSFVAWAKLPGKVYPRAQMPELVPDLAVEVLSPSNTPGEMWRKLKDYFLAGVRLVWLIDPDTRTARVHTAPDVFTPLTEGDSLHGGDVLPGFALPLARVFARLPRPTQ